MTDHRGVYGDHRYISTGDRRRAGWAEQSPADNFQQMRAVAVLERMPFPVLAIDIHGNMLFANAAFAAMLGHAQDTIEQLTFHEIFLNPVDGPAATALRAYADELVGLTHRDGFTVLARMSKSAMKRQDDEVALVVFEDLTEQLWTDSRVQRECPNAVKDMTNA
jgi:PAS domain S-box-containing protein